MKILVAYSLLLFAGLVSAQTDSCITPSHRVSIVFSDSLTSDTLWFGYHPLGTCGVDSILCGETQQWTPVPSTLDVSWIALRGLCYPPPYVDYRGLQTSPAAIDTFEIGIGAFHYPVNLRWNPVSIRQLYDSAELRYTTGSYFRALWMQQDSSVNLYFPDTFYPLQIYTHGQRFTSVSPHGHELPRALVLRQNYPNPFNPSTVIRFEVSTRSLVNLTIFDLLGRSVSTLISEILTPGVYERQFNSAGLPSGVYLCRLSSGSSLKTTKMLLLR